MGLVEISLGRWQGLMDEAWTGRGLEALFADDGFPAGGFSGEVEAVASNLGRTYRVRLADGGAIFAKHFRASSPIGLLLGSLQKRGAARSWRATRVAREGGLPTPRPVARFEQRRHGLTHRSVFISEAIPHAMPENLEDYFVRRFGGDAGGKELLLEKREVLRRLGQLFQAAHRQDRIYFPDFHPHNLVLQRPPGEALALYIVDFDEVRFGMRRDDRMKNLASLCRNAEKIMRRMGRNAITSGDRVRFLKAYLGEGASREQVAELAREIRANWNLK